MKSISRLPRSSPMPMRVCAGSARNSRIWTKSGRRSARIVRDGTRAGEVIGRIRALVKKVPPRREILDINQSIREVIALTQTETQRNAVRLQSRLADDLPLVSADRVQLQQVMINLIINAIEAMAGAGDGPRELTIVSAIDDADDVVVEVQDTGPGPRSRETRSIVPVLLHHQTRWDWHGAGDQPLDRRGPWRAPVGGAK